MFNSGFFSSNIPVITYPKVESLIKIENLLMKLVEHILEDVEYVAIYEKINPIYLRFLYERSNYELI